MKKRNEKKEMRKKCAEKYNAKCHTMEMICVQTL